MDSDAPRTVAGKQARARIRAALRRNPQRPDAAIARRLGVRRIAVNITRAAMIESGQLAPEFAGRRAPQRAAATALLRDLLVDGPVPTRTIREEAAARGLRCWRVVEDAGEVLGVVARKRGGTFGGGPSYWTWELPE